MPLVPAPGLFVVAAAAVGPSVAGVADVVVVVGDGTVAEEEGVEHNDDVQKELLLPLARRLEEVDLRA